MSSRATAPCWFPSGFPEAQKVDKQVVHVTPLRLRLGGPPARHRLVGVPQMCLQPPKFLVIKCDLPTNGRPAWPLTTQGGFYHQTPPAQRKRICWAQPTPPPGEKPSSIYISAPSGKRGVPADVKRIFAAGSSQPSKGPSLDSGPQKMRLSEEPLKTSKSMAPDPSLPKPIIPNKSGSEVLPSMRQLYLSLFLEDYLKLTSSPEEARGKARAEEKAAYDRSSCKATYVSAALDALRRLKGLAPSLVPGLNRAALYSRLRGYLLSEDQRKANGYPFPHPQTPGGAVLFTAGEKPQDSLRTCCRCGSKYDPSSYSEDLCRYHWGRIRRGPGASQYTCCSARPSARGCRVALQHVQDGRKENLQGFVETTAKPLLEDAHPGIYAVDCEMSYTVQGLELTRVTVLDAELRVVYDTFVKPDNQIVDYNTRFSGVTEEDLAVTSTTLRDVQAVLLNLFSADTILVGHSLECDLLALKLIHSAVVDTALLFPHRRGLPYKRSLRSLSAAYLRQTIQKSVKGHDPGEDAGACMRLVLWKVQEDAKTSQDPGQLPPNCSAAQACPKSQASPE